MYTILVKFNMYINMNNYMIMGVTRRDGVRHYTCNLCVYLIKNRLNKLTTYYINVYCLLLHFNHSYLK